MPPAGTASVGRVQLKHHWWMPITAPKRSALEPAPQGLAVIPVTAPGHRYLTRTKRIPLPPAAGRLTSDGGRAGGLFLDAQPAGS